MINKKTKTAIPFILAGIIFVSFAVTSCNNDSSDKTDAKVDTTATKMTQEAPAAMDTTPKMDTASTRPIVPAN